MVNALVIDTQVLTKLKVLMKDRFPQLIAKYLDTSRAYLDKIDTALAASDAADISAQAHAMKSSSLAIGAATVGTLAAELEAAASEAAKNGQGAASLSALSAALKAAFDIAEKELRTA